MQFDESRPHQYEIGENVYVYFNEGYEQATIKDRKQEFYHNFYLVEWGWEREAFLRKIQHYCKYVKREGESCTLNNNCTYPNCK